MSAPAVSPGKPPPRQALQQQRRQQRPFRRKMQPENQYPVEYQRKPHGLEKASTMAGEGPEEGKEETERHHSPTETAHRQNVWKREQAPPQRQCGDGRYRQAVPEKEKIFRQRCAPVRISGSA